MRLSKERKDELLDRLFRLNHYLQVYNGHSLGDAANIMRTVFYQYQQVEGLLPKKEVRGKRMWAFEIREAMERSAREAEEYFMKKRLTSGTVSVYGKG